MASDTEVRSGGAYVELGTKDTSLLSGLRKARKTLGEWADDVKRAAMKVGALGLALAAPLAEALRSFASYGSQVHDIAKRTGASTKLISEMGYAAKQAGSDLGDLERGIRFMQRSLAAAAGGQKEAIELYRRLGVNVEYLLTLPVDEQFEIVATRVGDITNPALRSAAAMEIFGRSGTAMIPVLENLNQMRQEAKLLGISLDQDVADNADEVGDTFERMRVALQGLKIAVAQQLAPAFLDLAYTFIGYVVAVRETIQANPELITQFINLIKSVFTLAGGLLVLYTVMALFTTVPGLFTLIGVAILGILDSAGVVDTGMRTLFENIRIGSHSIAGYWDALGDTMSMTWRLVMDGILWAWERFINRVYEGVQYVKVLWETVKAVMTAGSSDKAQQAMDKYKKMKEDDRAAEAANSAERLAARKAIANDIRARWAEDAEKPSVFSGLSARAQEVKGQLQKLRLPTPPEMSAGIDLMPDKKMGVAGFFGSSRISENIGQLAGTVEDQQLDVMLDSKNILEQIRDNTAKPVATYG